MDVVVVKNDGSHDVQAWATRADGSTVPVTMLWPHDLHHLIAESAFGIEHGFWGVLDRGGWKRNLQVAGARDRRRAANRVARVTDGVVAEHGREVGLAEAAVYAAANQFGDGSDDLEGVQTRLAPTGLSIDAPLLDAIRATTARLLAAWAELGPGGKLTITWPLPVTA